MKEDGEPLLFLTASIWDTNRKKAEKWHQISIKTADLMSLNARILQQWHIYDPDVQKLHTKSEQKLWLRLDMLKKLAVGLNSTL